MMVSRQTETAVGFKCMAETSTVVALYGNVLNLGELQNIHVFLPYDMFSSNVLGTGLKLVPDIPNDLQTSIY